MVADSPVRGITLGFLVLLAACSRGSTGVGTGPSGIEVADAALRGGSPEIALQIANGVLNRDPGSEAALLTQGEALTALGRSDDAALSFQQALHYNPQSVGAHIGLGRLSLATDPVAAEAQFLEAVAREPRNGVAWNNLGIARDLQGRHTDAQTAYRRALGVTPDMTAAQVNLALSMAMSGQSADAVQLLRPLASNPGASPQIRHDLAAVLVMAGDKAEAERILGKDLPPDEVRQAVEGYAAARPNAAASLMTAGTATPTPAAPASIAPAGSLQVQLAAAPSEDAAQAEWAHLQERMPAVLGGHQPIVVKAEKDGKLFWRLRTGGFADANDAQAFCARVREGGASCVVAQ